MRGGRAGPPDATRADKGMGMRVLLIEDDSATAQSIELMLKSENFNVYMTDLGEEGVDLGKLYDSTWGHRGRGAGAYAEQIEQMFRIASQKAGLNRVDEKKELSTAAFRVPGSVEQLGLL